jgi:hypothetical protein
MARIARRRGSLGRWRLPDRCRTSFGSGSVATLDHVFALLDRPEEDAAWFEGLNDYASQFLLDYQGAKQQVRVPKLFDVSQYMPLVLASKDVFSSPQEVVETLRYCAVLSVRFNGVSGRSTHLLEEIGSGSWALRSGTGRISRPLNRLCLADFVAESAATHD